MKNSKMADVQKCEGGQEGLLIDKTEALEKGIALFPSIYIEGAAATGKTCAMEMLRKKHPEAETYLLDLRKEADAMEGYPVFLLLMLERKHYSKCCGEHESSYDFCYRSGCGARICHFAVGD